MGYKTRFTTLAESIRPSDRRPSVGRRMIEHSLQRRFGNVSRPLPAALDHAVEQAGVPVKPSQHPCGAGFVCPEARRAPGTLVEGPAAVADHQLWVLDIALLSGGTERACGFDNSVPSCLLPFIGVFV